MSELPFFRVSALFSSSKGNSVCIRAGAVCFLIDAGMSCRAICTALAGIGETPDAVQAIFITHEHSDHVKALPVFLKKYPVPVYLMEDSAQVLINSAFPYNCFIIYPEPCTTVLRGTDGTFVAVTSFPTPHDSNASVGFRIRAIAADGKYYDAALVTDIGCITPIIRDTLIGVENVIIESNHDENMLMMGSYPYELKRRILSDRGHLSNAACGKFCCELVAGGTKHILLAHLSPENNTPDLAYLTVRAALKEKGYTENEDYTLAVAKRDCPVCLF